MQLHNHSIPLMFVGQGVRARLVGINGSQRTAHRLAELGFIPGVEVSVVADSGSALMVAVGDTRMALGYPLAQALLVAVLEKGSSR
ncbi:MULTISPECIES: FeoA family protein [unclassified Roseiflexus]|jgi:ferrous iron transport protein A|uniref:FeoA family protein n=1 Tax=unclassified Roseiflexus TaxID=2609473 RepID=UPI0000D7FB2E|nr:MULTISPECIES: FeoA family protein [unclassified Roseiflexus]ABQ88975.1 FeoA family protein [Roseiflexus sp. RS-1]